MKIDYLSIKSSLTMAGFQVSYFFYLFEKAPIVSPSFEEEAYFFFKKTQNLYVLDMKYVTLFANSVITEV